jgi:hypothetical protein
MLAAQRTRVDHAPEGKVAIITGAAHGMGEVEARLFAAEGAKVIVADILESDAEIVAADIRAGGGDATATKIDVTSEPDWIDLIANVGGELRQTGYPGEQRRHFRQFGRGPRRTGGLASYHRRQPDQRIPRHQACRGAGGEDRWRVDRQHQLDHGVCRQRQRLSGVSRL